MKTLLLFASILVSGLTSYSQVVVGPPPGTDPNPGVTICGRYCFTNTTNCGINICFASNDAKDQCTGELREVYECISLDAGQSGCIDLTSGEGCGLCPETYMIIVCGYTGDHCFRFTQADVGGYGLINCDGQYAGLTWHWDPATGTYILIEW